MAEERGATIIGGIETEIRGLVKDVAELKGAFGQMDKRLYSLETTVRQEIRDLRRDVRQIFYMVGGAIAVPILLEIVKKMVN